MIRSLVRALARLVVALKDLRRSLVGATYFYLANVVEERCSAVASF